MYRLLSSSRQRRWNPGVSLHQTPRKKEIGISKEGRPSTQPLEAPPSRLPTSHRGEESREVHLRSGGTLRLKLSVDLFDLDQKDRDFIFNLIDQLKKYEEETKTPG